MKLESYEYDIGSFHREHISVTIKSIPKYVNSFSTIIFITLGSDNAYIKLGFETYNNEFKVYYYQRNYGTIYDLSPNGYVSNLILKESELTLPITISYKYYPSRYLLQLNDKVEFDVTNTCGNYNCKLTVIYKFDTYSNLLLSNPNLVVNQNIQEISADAIIDSKIINMKKKDNNLLPFPILNKGINLAHPDLFDSLLKFLSKFPASEQTLVNIIMSPDDVYRLYQTCIFSEAIGGIMITDKFNFEAIRHVTQFWIVQGKVIDEFVIRNNDEGLSLEIWRQNESSHTQLPIQNANLYKNLKIPLFISFEVDEKHIYFFLNLQPVYRIAKSNHIISGGIEIFLDKHLVEGKQTDSLYYFPIHHLYSSKTSKENQIQTTNKACPYYRKTRKLVKDKPTPIDFLENIEIMSDKSPDRTSVNVIQSDTNIIPNTIIKTLKPLSIRIPSEVLKIFKTETDCLLYLKQFIINRGSSRGLLNDYKKCETLLNITINCTVRKLVYPFFNNSDLNNLRIFGRSVYYNSTQEIQSGILTPNLNNVAKYKIPLKFAYLAIDSAIINTDDIWSDEEIICIGKILSYPKNKKYNHLSWMGLIQN